MRVYCEWPWNKIKVSADGGVRNCCFQTGSICDVKDLYDQWIAGNTFRSIRECVARSEVEPTTCFPLKNCPFLGVDRKNLSNPRIVPIIPSYPTIIEVDLPNTTCNIGGPVPTLENPACVMCPRNGEIFTPDGQRFNEVLGYLRPFIPNCQELWLAGLGESFWKEQYIGILEKLDYFPHRFKCMYVTFSNGTLFNAQAQEKFMRLIPRSALIVSIDAGNRDTYKRIRRLDLFDTVIGNVKAYARDPRRNHQKQMLTITHNINLLNINDVEEMVEMWQGEKITDVAFNPTCVTGAKNITDYTVNADNYNLFMEASQKIREAAKRCRMKNVTIVSPLESYFKIDAQQKLSIG